MAFRTRAGWASTSPSPVNLKSSKTIVTRRAECRGPAFRVILNNRSGLGRFVTSCKEIVKVGRRNLGDKSDAFEDQRVLQASF